MKEIDIVDYEAVTLTQTCQCRQKKLKNKLVECTHICWLCRTLDTPFRKRRKIKIKIRRITKSFQMVKKTNCNSRLKGNLGCMI